jgi:hypothetical protein
MEGGVWQVVGAHGITAFEALAAFDRLDGLAGLVAFDALVGLGGGILP